MSDERNLEELMSLVELPGPLPDGLEDRIWGSTAATYEDLRARATIDRPPMSDANVVELDAARPAPAAAVRPARSTWILVLGAAAAAIVLVVAGALLVVSDRDGSAPSDQLDETRVDWVSTATAANDVMRERVVDADALRTRTIDLGLSSVVDYLDEVSAAASLAAGALGEPPDSLAAAALAHDEALTTWSSGARQLAADIAADPDSFVFEDGLLVGRLDRIVALEEAALEATCHRLRSALADDDGGADFQCGAISTLNEPPPPQP